MSEPTTPARELAARIAQWREDDKGGYDQAIALLCEAEAAFSTPPVETPQDDPEDLRGQLDLANRRLALSEQCRDNLAGVIAKYQQSAPVESGLRARIEQLPNIQHGSPKPLAYFEGTPLVRRIDVLALLAKETPR